MSFLETREKGEAVLDPWSCYSVGAGGRQRFLVYLLNTVFSSGFVIDLGYLPARLRAKNIDVGTERSHPTRHS